MKKLQELLPLICIILQCYLLTSARKKEGSSCKLPAICKRVINCTMALESMKKTSTPGLKRCGFVGVDELICCPSVDNTNFNSTEKFPGPMSPKTSKEFCDELVKGYNSKPIFFISDGAPADSGEYPHMALLGYPKENETKPEWKCGATIISHKFLLTAAHCIRDKSQVSPTIARLGITKLDEINPQDYIIEKAIMHPDYNGKIMHNDIALIEINGTISFGDKASPACLYFQHDIPSSLTATGWGATNSKGNSTTTNALMEAVLDSLPNSECHEYYSKRLIEARNISDTQFCAKYKTGDTCEGDSGGPLQIKINQTYFVVGITSFGQHCDETNLGVYTRVSKYVEWIDNIIWS